MSLLGITRKRRLGNGSPFLRPAPAFATFFIEAIGQFPFALSQPIMSEVRERHPMRYVE